MSVTQPDRGFDASVDQLRPALIAILIAAVTAVITLAITGLPH